MSRKILVVDDSDNIRTVLKVNFEWIGYDVLSARDGEEAIRMMEEEKPDLIILDVMMPRKNGYQVCRRFKSDPRTADIPVILLTARIQEEDAFWGRDCGADEFITKPFQTPDLESAVRRLLTGSSTQGGREKWSRSDRRFVAPGPGDSGSSGQGADWEKGCPHHLARGTARALSGVHADR